MFEATHMSTDEDFSHRVQLPQNLFKPQFICCNTRNELIISSGYTWKVITFQGKCTEVLLLNSKAMEVITFQHVFVYVLCVYMDYEFEECWIYWCGRCLIVDVKSDSEHYIGLYVFELVLPIFGCSETCQHSAL